MAQRVKRPESEVSEATGLVGALSLTALTAFAAATGMPVFPACLLLLVGTALPMVLWAVVVEKVQRRQTTGLDFSLRRPAAEVGALTRVKFIGLIATFLLIGLSYFAFKYYQRNQFDFFHFLLATCMPFVLLAAPVYIWFVSRHMTEPKDGLWHFGKLVCLQLHLVDREKVTDHLRCWAIKGFFLAFMVSIFPGIVAGVLRFDFATALHDPIQLAWFLLRVFFLFDVCFGTIGYILTVRPLDSHIRSANPYLAGWVAALVCYPPFALVGAGGPLDYRSGTQDWTVWLAQLDVLLLVWTFLVLALTFVYAWATVIFGFRFSNLTHRGIITNGPYRYFKHPAYLSKNLFWWLVHVPFLATAGPAAAVQNCLLLLCVNAIYYARAKTEERHLAADPRYRAYSDWIAENGVLARCAARLRAWARPPARAASSPTE